MFIQRCSASHVLLNAQRVSTVLVLVGVCFLIGCSPQNSLIDHRADVAVPEQWSAAFGQPQPHSPTDISKWWRLFGDNQLSVLVEEALQSNPNVLGAQAAVRQARAAKDVQAATLFPNVGASASVNRSKQGESESRTSYSVGMDASWEPDWWGAKGNRIAASDASLQASQATLEGTWVSLAAEVAQTYIELRGLQDRLRIAQQNLKIQKQTLQITQWRVQAGLATSLEAEQARQSVAQTQAQIPTIDSSLKQSIHALSILTGRTPALLLSELQVAKLVPQPPADLAMALPADTLRQRPDVRAAQFRIEAALANLSAQEVANYPSLRLSGSIGLSALTMGALTNGASLATGLLAGLSGTLFDAGANRAQVRAQTAAVEQAQSTYVSTVLTALREVEDALVQLQADKDRLANLRIAESAAQNAWLLAQQRYKSGLIDFQVVLDTQRTLLSSQDSIATTTASISTDYVRLYKALGGGWPANADFASSRIQ